MADNDNVSEALPSLQFTVKEAALLGTGTGVRYGILVLRCTVRDIPLWEAAVEKMDGYKVFSSTSEEIMDALGMELTETRGVASSLRRMIYRQKNELEDKEQELQKMREFFREIETDLGIAP